MQVGKAVVFAREASGEAEWPGFGFRARPLLPVANKPVLFHVLDGLRAGGIDEVALVVGGATRADIRAAVGNGRRFELAVEYLDSPADVGVVDVLREADGFLEGEPFVVQEGDALLRDGIGELARRFSAERLDALVLRLPRARGLDGGARRTRTDGSLSTFGGCFLGPGALRADVESRLGLPGLLAHVREHGGRIRVAQVAGCLPCRGGRDALLDANREALESLRGEPVAAELNEAEIQGPVVVHPTARFHHSLVRGPAVVGPRVELRHAYVGPYTSLGADVVVEGSEVENSILLDGARVCFLGARLEASIVGREARVGRDYGLPHAIRLVVADGAEVTLS